MKILFFVFMLVCLGSCSDEVSKTTGEDMNPSREEKFKIISKAGDSGDVSQADGVASFLRDKDSEVVGRACFNLGYLGARAYINEIKNFLYSDDHDLLTLCLSGLTLMVDSRDENLLEQILPLVNHESRLVRMSAVEVLGNMQSQKASKILMDRFDREVSAVQYEIIKALGKIGDKNALPLLRSYKKVVEKMDHSMPRKGGARGIDPHPDVLAIVTMEAIELIQNR